MGRSLAADREACLGSQKVREDELDSPGSAAIPIWISARLVHKSINIIISFFHLDKTMAG
jgi:hypothetical protein